MSSDKECLKCLKLGRQALSSFDNLPMILLISFQIPPSSLIQREGVKSPLTLPSPARGEGKHNEIEIPSPLRGEGEGEGD